ncbi:hypothetical protein TA3x_002161 [Tundrisphaera sp. TA3]|uniref:hypothetical protein n=1 Tax=Tundrisphaera sp. TA3 TaxID=3435775 RepID=UPI003EBB9B38
MAGDIGLDPTFHPPDGRVSLDFNNAVAVSPLRVQTDGRILSVVSIGRPGGGTDFGIERLTPDGFPDPTFGTLGRSTISFASDLVTPTNLALQPDGKIVVVGTADLDFAAVRFTADGQPDTSFGAGGRVVIPYNAGGLNVDGALQVAVQADGRIVVAGIVQRTFPIRFFPGNNDIGLARLNADGSLDGTFGVGGKVTFGFGGVTSEPAGLAVDPDGRVIVVGTGRPAVGIDPADFQVARLRADGSVDSSFGSGGVASVDFGAYDLPSGVSALPDGRIVVGGSTLLNSGVARPVFARLTADGRPDATFDGDGKVYLPTLQSFYPAEMTVQPDGRIIALLGLSGLFSNSIGAGIVGLAADGTPDPTYLRANATFGDDIPIARFAIQPFGGIIVQGSSPFQAGRNVVVARLAPTQAPIGELLERTPPQLVAAQAVFAGGRRRLTGVTLSFDEGLDPATVTADRFRLGVVVRRSRGKVTTRPLRVAAASYDANSGLVTLRAANKVAIPRGARIVIRPGLADLAGNATTTQIVAFVR